MAELSMENLNPKITPLNPLNDPNEKPSDDLVSSAYKDKKIYDPGERIADKMNRGEGDSFDRTTFITELWGNYLVAVQLKLEKLDPKTKLVGVWDERSTFEEFLEASKTKLEYQISSLKIARAAALQKVRVFSDQLLSEIKIDKGSAQALRQFDVEDYEATYEILSRAKETIEDLNSGKLIMTVDKRDGTVRLSTKLSLAI